MFHRLELKEKSRKWLQKADINTDPDELYVDGAATIDDEQVTYDDGGTKISIPRVPSMDVMSEAEQSKGVIIDTIQKIRGFFTGQGGKSRLPKTAPIPYRKMSSEQQVKIIFFTLTIHQLERC